jgi:tRNA dimethylallyltransferase
MISFLLGPTASGKSELALAWARKHDGWILSLDSMQVYRGLDIGTGKATFEERKKIRHGGLDLVEPGESFSVADYLKHAEEFLNEAREEQNPVIICGGTGLYYRALTQGLANIPETPPELRAELDALLVEELQQRLKAEDPQAAAVIDLQNPRRVARALAVWLLTGKSIVDWQRENSPPLVPSAPAFILEWEREALRERIAQRVQVMLSEGWVEEVRALCAQHGTPVVERLAAIGYPELVEWLQSGGDWASVQQRIVETTRQYAKRQLTWFRRETNLISLKREPSTSLDLLVQRLDQSLSS